MSAYRVGWLIAAGALALVVMVAAMGAFAGLTTFISAAAILVVLVMVVTSPWMADATQRWVRTVSGPSEGQMEAVVQALAGANPGLVPFQPLPQVQPATDEQLCQAWCDSYRTLEATTSRRKFIRIVEERGGYLDELERRNPAAFTAWLASGATPAGNPLPFLSLAQIDRPAINWDELIDGQGW
jgi:hypothetical protein